MKTGILYFTTCFHGFGILRHVDPFVRMLHIYASLNATQTVSLVYFNSPTTVFFLTSTGYGLKINHITTKAHYEDK